MTDLIARIESASEGSRKLSDECLLAAGFEYGAPVGPSSYGMVGWKSPIGTKYNDLDAPDPTRNLQDVLDWMVPGGAEYDIRAWTAVNGSEYATAIIYVGVSPEEGVESIMCATPALALTAAALRAREADHG